jgi:hypothetical protein
VIGDVNNSSNKALDKGGLSAGTLKIQQKQLN